MVNQNLQPPKSPSRLGDYTSAIRACSLCLNAPSFGVSLPHQPRPILQISEYSSVLIAGQAPGTKVHQSGRPFTDRSGDRLRSWLGVSCDEFYDDQRISIVPMGFCFPGQDAKGSDLPPRRECVATWHDGLFERRGPFDLVLSIGRYARDYHLPAFRREPLTETIQRFAIEAKLAETAPVVQLPHPSWRNTAWLKRNPWFEGDVLPIIRERVRGAMGSRK